MVSNVNVGEFQENDGRRLAIIGRKVLIVDWVREALPQSRASLFQAIPFPAQGELHSPGSLASITTVPLGQVRQL